MLSFYGGQNGQSFTIKQVFNNCAALVADLTDVNSSVEIDEYVTIFYGKPGSSDYQINFDTDNPSEEEISAGAVKYGNRNASFWKKVYKLEDEIDELEKSKYLSNTNTNIRYYNLGYFSANTTMVTVNSTTGIAPVDEPKVSINQNSTPDQYLLDFEIPKASQFYYGNLIDIKKLHSVTGGSTSEIINQDLYDLCEDGDFYIVESCHFIYQIIKHGPVTGRVVLKYCGQLSINLNEITTSYIDTYKKNEDGSYVLSDIKIRKMEWINTNGGGIEETNLEIRIPHIPDFSVDSVQTTEAGTSASAIIKHKDANTLAFDFTIPKGDTGAIGPIGPVGPGFDIINMIEVTGANENINETIVAKLNQLYTTKPESTQIIGVNYIDSSIGAAIASYWYCWTQNAWHSVNAFGGSNLSWKEF